MPTPTPETGGGRLPARAGGQGVGTPTPPSDGLFPAHAGVVAAPSGPRPTPAPAPTNGTWTFGPDGGPEPGASPPGAGGPGAVSPEGPDRVPAARQRGFPSVALVVFVCLVVTGALALTHSGPFHPSDRGSSAAGAVAPVDIRGTWNVLVVFHVSFSAQQMHISAEDLSTGVFAGTVTSPVGVETMKGKVVGSMLSFTIGLGNGTETGTASVATTAGQLRMSGDFSNTTGGSGAISAVRKSG